MSFREPPRLSDLIENEESILKPSSRRKFIANASALSLAIPGIGAALTACSPAPAPTQKSDSTGGREHDSQSDDGRHRNSDSKLDTSLLKGGRHGNSSVTRATPQNEAPFHRFSPELPPPSQGKLSLHWHAKEARIRISDDIVVAAWTFEGDIPGPIVHCRVGDTVEFTLTNDVDVPHSMDFHAAQIDPKHAFKSVPKGQSVTYSFKPKWAGGFMYHCGTAPVLMHIGSGMYGALIVSPREPLPPAKEFVLIQSEFYLADAANGLRAFDYQRMLGTVPDLVAFNGRPNQYIKEPIKVKLGDRVRFWVVNAGPTHPCNFHVVGEQFDTMYIGSPPGGAIRGVQTWEVAPGGGICFELLCDVAGEFPFVNHGFGHGQKGAMGFLIVE
ncbi:MAG TPA: multicopper oxidase domain-containing protein [Gemmatimonadaceae bacterium]|jgi:nitrite reductase (NO-forming)|nr:multicopper oxidase domain-containing protein [Gemmatimonadaceae bacterium]